MDTTEDYIIMCKKTADIQNSWIPDYYDYVFKQASRHQQVMCIIHRLQLEAAKKGEEGWQKGYIWLPRQDQLQEMIDIEIISKYTKLTTFDMSLYYIRFKALDLWIDKLSQERNHYADRFLAFSGEQLWLAFVMYERYSKIWNGKEWE